MTRPFPFDREIKCTRVSLNYPCNRPATGIIFKEDTQEVLQARCDMCSNDERFKALEDRVALLERPKWGTPDNVRWLNEKNITIVYHKDE